LVEGVLEDAHGVALVSGQTPQRREPICEPLAQLGPGLTKGCCDKSTHERGVRRRGHRQSRRATLGTPGQGLDPPEHAANLHPHDIAADRVLGGTSADARAREVPGPRSLTREGR